MAESEFAFQDSKVEAQQATFSDAASGPPGLIYKTGHSFYADPGTFLWNQSAVNTGISISLGIIIFYIIIQMLFVVGDGLKNLLDKFITKTEKGRSLSNMEGLTHLTNSVMEAIIKFGNKNDEKRSQGKEN